MILNTTGLFYRINKLPKKYFVALLIYLLYMTAVILLHMFYYLEIPVVLGMSLFALVSFGLILSDNMEKHIRQEHQIAHQRAEILILQMRPTLDFTTYLRKNFAAIASEDTVPFTDELEHSRAYLAVEQAQFEDTLFVSFDTPHTLFRVPPLTMQPLVENAVKHGMKSGRDPIHISVATRKTDKGSEIIVEDDGAGFDPVEDNEPHIALNNIRQRLEMMCKGTLEIKAREGGGTSVRVTIPEQK